MAENIDIIHVKTYYLQNDFPQMIKLTFSDPDLDQGFYLSNQRVSSLLERLALLPEKSAICLRTKPREYHFQSHDYSVKNRSKDIKCPRISGQNLAESGMLFEFFINLKLPAASIWEEESIIWICIGMASSQFSACSIFKVLRNPIIQ